MSYDGKAIAEEVQSITASLRDEIVDIRRHLHQFPELSWKEVETTKFLAKILMEEALDVKTEICRTGLMADIEGGERGKTIAFRADMDALPMNDVKDTPYASRIPGVMHSCGHDCHMAIAVGVAKVLKRLNLKIPGNVRLIFQPCEEGSPSGARELVKAGVMDKVDGILAFHVDPEIPVGKIGLREGILTAYCSEFRLSVFGRSGHAARPHLAVDTIYLSNRVLSALYDIIGERNHFFMPAVLTVGKIEGGTKANVIPDVVKIAGSVRTIDAQLRQEIITAVEEKVHAITRSAGGSYQLEFPAPVPSVVNNDSLVNLARETATLMLPEKNIVDIKSVSMGGEDFSWFLTKAPGALIRLGARKPGGEVTYLHTNHFDIDEKALPTGVSLMSMLVLRYLFQDDMMI